MIHMVDKHIVFLWSSESCFMLENGQVVSCQDASPFQKLQLLAGAESKLAPKKQETGGSCGKTLFCCDAKSDFPSPRLGRCLDSTRLKKRRDRSCSTLGRPAEGAALQLFRAVGDWASRPCF